MNYLTLSVADTKIHLLAAASSLCTKCNLSFASPNRCHECSMFDVIHGENFFQYDPDYKKRLSDYVKDDAYEEI